VDAAKVWSDTVSHTGAYLRSAGRFVHARSAYARVPQERTPTRWTPLRGRTGLGTDGIPGVRDVMKIGEACFWDIAPGCPGGPGDDGRSALPRGTRRCWTGSRRH